MKLSILFACAGFIVLASCTKNSKESASSLPDPLIQNRDTTVSPADDFFHYALGGWFHRNEIPASESSNGIFRMIADTINLQVKHICERSAADATAPKGSSKQKIGDFYASGMDTVAVEKAGITPLAEELQKINDVTDVPSLMAEIAHLHSIGVDPGYSFYIGQDDKISSKYAVFFGQGGLGLGDREYYFNKDSRTANIRKEYLKHLEAMDAFLGDKPAAAASNAAIILKLETDLAKASRKLEDLRDPVKNYNKMTLTQFSKSTPGVSWRDVLKEYGISDADTVIVGQPEFFVSLNKLLTQYPAGDWKTYLKWNLISSYANYLNKDIVLENFKFFGTVISGTTKQRPRWKRVVQQTDRSLGELIGQVYVDEYLPKGSKEKLLEIGDNIRSVYAEHIRNLDWMSEATKAKAQDKLSKIVMKVGYPDTWKDLSNLEINRSSWCGNVMKAHRWAFQYMVSKFGKPVDRTEWGMYPHTYNAYYNPSNNEICLPACNVIVPGFEGRLPDDAILYGIVGGSTIGHEITHGFDDQGSQYDAEGNLKDWWTKEDREKFVAKTRRIVRQFNKFSVLDSMHVNGSATQGENIADLGGVVMGYEAFKKTPQYQQHEIISGLSPDQRYFLGYGYSWMVNSKSEALARQVMTDVHSPAQFRVNGPLSNIPEFYQAFNVKAGDPMFQHDSLRVAIW